MKNYKEIIVIIAMSLCMVFAFLPSILSKNEPPEDLITVNGLATYSIKCADTNGNITIDRKLKAYGVVADDLTFSFKLESNKLFVVSGFCFLKEE